MALLCYNLTGAPVVLVAGNPPPVIPASSAPPSRGPAFNVTSELRGLTGPQYAALEAQRSGTLVYEWTNDPEYDVGVLTIAAQASFYAYVLRPGGSAGGNVFT